MDQAEWRVPRRVDLEHEVLGAGMLVVFEDRAPMSRKTKWIEADSPDEPAVDVAQRALKARLRSVWRWLKSAACESDQDVEIVHQLRVSTRRAMASLEIFSAMLPPKRGAWLNKQLRRIRKAAGDARDLDVLKQRLATVCDGSGLAGCAALTQRVNAAREAAQEPICETYEKLQGRFARRARKLDRKVRWRSSESGAPTYFESAQAGLRPIAAGFFSAAEANLDDTQALHEFRIAAKQLRYAMETFAAALGPAIRTELYPVVEGLQEKLGEINDHAAARDRYLVWLDDTPDESQRIVLGKLIATETSALQESTRRFHEWWTPARAADLKTRFWQEVSGEARCA